ncbi:hypothetical protein VUR80DRAFT_4949 [Thermomyces stellatus]
MPASRSTDVTRGRRLSKGQSSASITILPKSAHTFDDTAPPKRSDPHAMQRQDSGYESLVSVRSAHGRKRSSESHQASSRSATTSRRPHRVTGLSLYPQQQPATLFQFPEPDLPAPEYELENQRAMPPPTTQYWTSDQTRRLEYAAIDAARRGIRGWARRNLVPRCMTAKDGGHLDFDDDTGSVRRYRLDIDETETKREKKRGWLSWLKG